jgi:hypothetical protein
MLGREHLELLTALQTDDFVPLDRLLRVDNRIGLLGFYFSANGFGVLQSFQGLKGVVQGRVYLFGGHLLGAVL